MLTTTTTRLRTSSACATRSACPATGGPAPRWLCDSAATRRRKGAGVNRAAMRRACREVGLRVRTGLADDGALAWTYHVDHVLTEASSRASRRAIEAALASDMTAPFHELVRQEQRKMLRPVPRPSDQV